ncbi:MAG: alkaline shock response membrane anchor protein AmaP [Firmicutes bacterium]|nr:alkaline shock response membrane anchor protein AmaP [Bacillota bacterium]
MNILLRVLLVIYALCFIFVAILAMFIAINNGVLSNIYYRLDASISSGYYSTVVIIIISLFLLISAIIFLIAGLKTDRDKKAISKYTNIGEVKISLNSIENIALNAAGKFSGIRDVRAFVSKVDDNVSITIKASVLPDIIIPVISNEIQETVKNAVEESSGVMVADVRVFIENIYSGPLPKQKAE